MTTIIRADVAMTAPDPGTPIVNDVFGGLVADFHASTLTVGTFTGWTDRVGGVQATAIGSGITVTSTNGKLGVRLPGSALLKAPVSLGAAVTKIIVLRLESAGQDARMLSGPPESFRAIRRAASGPWYGAAGIGSTTGYAALAPGLQAHAASFQGQTIRATRDRADVAVFTGSGTLPASSAAETIGGAEGDPADQRTITGTIHRVLYFNRAFTSEELRVATAYYVGDWA